MPRVHRVKKARKDNPAVKKGQPYYWWKFRYGGKRYSTTYPRRSQLTQSDKLSRIYAAEETVEDAQRLYEERHSGHGGGFAVDVGELLGALDEAADELEDVGEEYRDNIYNMPEGLQQGDVANQMEEKADACEAAAESCREAKDNLEDVEDQFQEFNVTKTDGEDPYELVYEWVIEQLEDIEWPSV